MNNRVPLRRIFLIVVGAILVFGISYYAYGDYYRDLSKQLKAFNELYKQLVVNYVDQIDPEALLEEGIEGMLGALDPYTVYLEKEDQHGIRTLTEGKYGGVGIRLGVQRDTLTVIAPMEGSPASRAGIQSGDKIVQIDTIGTAEMRLSRAANLMRGEPGTSVTLTIVRPGVDERLPFVLTREDIVVQDLAFAGIVDEGMMYLKLTSFSRNSGKEIRSALADVSDDSMRAVILDLRGNPGGLLTSALDVVDLFVEPGQQVLATRGRNPNTNQSYETEREPIIPTNLPMAVLVDKGSASASEIVAGVLQDLDRAVILGSETFGKGLVQTVIPLGESTSVKVTTAKYYIPSGRLIQKEDYFDEDVVREPTERDSVYYTNNHRKVYGGGGITPDLLTARDTIPEVIQMVGAKNHFFNFAVEYHNSHENRAWPFPVNDTLRDQFMEYLQKNKFSYSTRSFRLFKKFTTNMDTTAPDYHRIQGEVDSIRAYLKSRSSWQKRSRVRQWITRSLERELAQVYGGREARIRAQIKEDRTVQTALDILWNQPRYRQQLGYAVAAE